MKEPQSEILSKIGRRQGMTVPPGYFDSLASKIGEKLPEHPAVAARAQMQKRGWWRTVRPYAYMAAMFAGVWCMLKMFTLITGVQQPMSIDNNPTLAEAVNNDTFIQEYCLDDIDSYDIMQDMYEDGIAIDDFDLYDESSLNDLAFEPVTVNE